MKKILIGILIFIFIVVGGIYCVLFTPPGNNIVKGILENKLNSKIPVKVNIKEFKLTPNKFSIKIYVKNNSFLYAHGRYSIFTKNIDGNYEIKLIDLAKFEKIINYRLNGNFYTRGECKGKLDLLDIVGTALVADSNLKYKIKLKNLDINDLSIHSHGIKISNLLYLLNLPNYADGFIDINGEISKFKIKIYKGKAFKKILNKEFGLELTKDISFKGVIVNRLVENKLIIDAKIFSSIANLNLSQLAVNLNDLSINGNYILSIQDLNNLYDLLQTKLRGNAIIKGKISKIKESFYIDGKSKMFNGKINFTFKDNIFNLKINNINTSKLLYTLYYPEMFDANGGGVFNYKILKENGNFDFKFKNGRLIKRNLTFIPRTIVGLVYVFTGVDLVKELFKVVNLDGTIAKKIIHANLYLKSKLAEIKSDNSIIDLNRETIKSLVNLKIGGMNFSILVAGKLNKPSIKLNPGKSILNRPELKELKKQKKKLENEFKKLFN